MGSAMRRLLVGALWPLFAMAAVQLLLLLIGVALELGRGKKGSKPQTSSTDPSLAEDSLAAESDEASMRRAVSEALQRGVAFAILLSFCVLPSVSQAIFDTWACESFELDDAAGESISYMRSDLTVECGGAEHDALVNVSYALMVLWPIGVPLSYLALLWHARAAIRQRQPTFVAESTRFLWVEYEADYFCAPTEDRTWDPFTSPLAVPRLNIPHCQTGRSWTCTESWSSPPSSSSSTPSKATTSCRA